MKPEVVMKMQFKLSGAILALGFAGFLPAQSAYAQLCQPAGNDFEKTVALVDRDGNGQPTPGDDLDFTVLMCNSGTTSCFSTILDNIDDFLIAAGIPVDDLNLIPLPPKTGCPADGGAICSRGPRGGPYTELVGTTFCGQDCSAPADTVRFQPVPATQQLSPGQCYEVRFRAHIAAAVAQTECLCDQASAVIDFIGGQAFSNDPNYVSLEPGPGCLDTETCPQGAGRCATCVKVLAEANISTSTKCIQGAPNCASTTPKAPGAQIVYEFTITNTGTADTAPVIFRDPLDFVSDATPATPCIDTTGTPIVSALNCSWGPCGAPDYEIVWDSVNRIVVSSPNPLLTIPAGGTLTFTVTATVAAGANGNCTNLWEMITGLPPTPINGLNRPVFNVSGNPVVVSVTKTPEFDIVPANKNFGWNVIIENTGTQAANNVTFTDTLPACATLVGGSCNAIPAIPINCTAPGPITPVNPFTLAASATQILTFTTLAGAAPTPPIADCVNTLQASGGNFNATSGQGGVCIGGISVTKTPGTPQVDPNANFVWNLTIRNNCASKTARGVNFSDDITAGTPTGCQTLVSCGTPTPPTVTVDCGVTTPGVVTASAPFDIAPGASVVIPITVNSGTTPGTCQNNVTVSGTNLGAFDPFSGSVDIRNAPAQLEVIKSASASPVPPGVDFTYTIQLNNRTSSPITGIRFSDDVDVPGLGCDAQLISCGSNPNIPSLACTLSPVTAGPFNIAANGTQEITITLRGNADGTCNNIADVTDSSVGAAASNASRVVIQTAGQCSLNGGDVTVLAPITPPKTAPWVYTKTCTAADNNLATVILPVASTGVDVEPLSSTPPLRLYQLDCGCVNRLGFVKRGTPAQVHMEYF